MEEFRELPESIQRQLNAVADQTGIVPPEAALQAVTENWVEKHRLYREQVAALHMVDETYFAIDDPRGALLLTYSGSLVVLGPRGEDGRRFEYASISIRTDVPDLAGGEAVEVLDDIRLGSVARFRSAPIERSSEIYAIASFNQDVPLSEQTERLRQAEIFLTNGFINANRSLTGDPTETPDRFTARSIVQYVAARNATTQTLAKSIIDDYISTLESGVLLGECVSIGHLGKISLSVRPAQKPRMGRNPATGEEILIPAKPEHPVPRFNASGRLKERAAAVPVERVRPIAED